METVGPWHLPGRRRPPGWVGDVIAAVVIAALALAPFPGREYRATSALALGLTLTPIVLLPLRRRRPIAVLVAVVALYGAAALTGTLSPGVAVAAAVAMFAVSNRHPRRVSLIVMLATAASILLLSLLAATVGALDARVVQFAVVIAFAAAAGDATRSRREYIEAVTERAERAEQTRESEARRRVTEERLRIARDLHDAVAHQISVISLNAGVASSALETRPEKAREALGTIRTAARSVLGEIGDLLEVLRSDERIAESAGPQPGLDRLDELVRRFEADGLQVTLRTEGEPDAVTGAVDLVAYRVVQEALTNAHKHGAEHRAHVLVDVGDDRVEIVVTNPVPAESAPAPRGAGHGLLGLRERVASVRGSVTTGPAPGGYRLAAALPLPLTHAHPAASPSLAPDDHGTDGPS
ncbi:sensor histidine kinase [Rathayibacter sp. VKM Ac-2754]|uniref:sensor histidine kinase n=1 Tax=Rathayibacter sp. VKM Ac-2754 TaxID=2609251 RepID=UPI00135CE969|nr:histidine kinase [Rathayibacter sp. VKM Ac-2754]MWV60351.1 sensor histidine kinase [Rathayibacter sp. VKM Ac-2754]